jgi:uncharacterized protein (DUF433 family)
MSYRDTWAERLMREQAVSKNALTQVYERIIRENQKEFASLHRTATEAAVLATHEAVAALHVNQESIYRQIALTQVQLLKNLNVPLIRSFAEIAHQAIMPLSQSMVAEIAKTLPRADFASLASQAIRDLKLSTIGGNSTAVAYAALAAAQAQGFESVRESFAGVTADILRAALMSLDRDEEAFTHFEELIDEKITTLPHNEVTAESLLRFLLMLFIALGSLGAEIAQTELAVESSKTQDEQQSAIRKVLERIADNIERLNPEKDQNVYYLVDRTVDLKLKPQERSLTITRIFRNQKTRLVRKKHRWIYVEYFDYLEAIPKYGWAKKKYFKRVQGDSLGRDANNHFPGIESTRGVMGGVPSIANTRIPVWLLEQARRLGTSESDLLRDYPGLTAQDLTNAWNFVRSHRAEVDAQIEANEKDDD